jgi:hypothetical protein
MPREFTPEEVDEINRRAREFLKEYKAQPLSEKHLNTNERLDGPVEFRVVTGDDRETDPADE